MSNSFCDPKDCSPPGSSFLGISQERTLEWVSTSFSRDLPNPEIELHLPNCRQILLRLSHPGRSISTLQHSIFNYLFLLSQLIIWLTWLVAQLVKNLPAMRDTWVQSLGWENPLERGKATHSSILTWRIPWTVKSMGSQRVGHDWVTCTLTLWFFLKLILFCCIMILFISLKFWND